VAVTNRSVVFLPDPPCRLHRTVEIDLRSADIDAEVQRLSALACPECCSVMGIFTFERMVPAAFIGLGQTRPMDPRSQLFEVAVFRWRKSFRAWGEARVWKRSG
jgi:hypothetical protein